MRQFFQLKCHPFTPKPKHKSRRSPRDAEKSSYGFATASREICHGLQCLTKKCLARARGLDERTKGAPVLKLQTMNKVHSPQEALRSHSASSLSRSSPAAKDKIIRYLSSADALKGAPLSFKKRRIAIKAVRLFPSEKG